MRIHQRLHARCACSSAPGPFVLAGTTRQYERSRPFSITHLSLDLELDFAKKSVSGSATLSFRRVAPEVDELRLDALGFELLSVELLNGKRSSPAEYDYDSEAILVRGLKSLAEGRIRISYRVTPRRGLYFLGPDDKVKDRPVQVWSQCQDEDARHWFPCHDKPHVKMTTELKVRVPHGFLALSNGELVAAETPKSKGAAWTYHFSLNKPHPSYLVTLVAGQFDVVEDRPAELGPKQIPVTYYVPKGRRADAKRSLGETPNMLELFSKVTGQDYPWERYSQVVVSDFIFGGMENTTATTLYEYALLDERAALDITANDLVAHELAHQWFGDFLTCRDWSHAWLNEGFATYFEHIEREHRLGRDEYDYGVATDVESYLSEARGRYQRPIVCRDYAEPIDLFDRHLYEKGGLVLHQLRRLLGDEIFFAGIKKYLERHAHGIVETTDLQRALEEVSGRSLERFFDQWVFRPGHPDLRVKVAYEDKLLTVSLKQRQKGDNIAIFELPFEIEVVTKSGERVRHSKTVTEDQDSIVVALDERPAYVVFDPDFRVVANLTLEAPADMLRAQLEKGERAHARWSAAESLGKRDDIPTITALASRVADEKESWMVRSESARALGHIRADEALSELEKLTRVKHPKVRRAVVSALGAFKNPRAVHALTPLANKDASYLVEAEAARSLGRTRQPSVLKTLLKLVDRSSWGDVTRAGAIDGLASLRDEAAVDPVLERTAYGHPTRGRRAAIAALPVLSDSRKVREHLELLLDDRDPHLKIEVVAAIEKLGDLRARGALRQAMELELDGRVVRRIREALAGLSDSSAGDRRKLRDELEGLRDDLAELKSRLTKLESSKKDTLRDPRRRESASAKSKKSAAPAAPRARAKTRSKRKA